MPWCCQATSHYLSQCWPSSLSPYGVTRPQWLNAYSPWLYKCMSNASVIMNNVILRSGCGCWFLLMLFVLLLFCVYFCPGMKWHCVHFVALMNNNWSNNGYIHQLIGSSIVFLKVICSMLTHGKLIEAKWWYASVNLAIIGWDNDFAPVWCQASISARAGLLLLMMSQHWYK